MSYSGERIAKVMAARGLCSRRQAEQWILEGRVTVNGETLTSPALNVTERDIISVAGKPLPDEAPLRLWRFHKPRGYLTTHRDPEGRATLFSLLPRTFPRVISIGRLDMDSEGLILLTNKGTVAHTLESPQTAWIRTYRVRVYGRRIELDKLEALKSGITIDGMVYRSIVASLETQKASNAWLNVKITEGKNREIRRICEHLGWPVSRLIRVGFGPFQLGDLKEGMVEEVPARILKNSLNKDQL